MQRVIYRREELLNATQLREVLVSPRGVFRQIQLTDCMDSPACRRQELTDNPQDSEQTAICCRGDGTADQEELCACVTLRCGEVMQGMVVEKLQAPCDCRGPPSSSRMARCILPGTFGSQNFDALAMPLDNLTTAVTLSGRFPPKWPTSGT